MIVCKACGYKNEVESGFCGSCGSFLEWTGERIGAEYGSNESVKAALAEPNDGKVPSSTSVVTVEKVPVEDDPDDTSHLEVGSALAARYAQVVSDGDGDDGNTSVGMKTSTDSNEPSVQGVDNGVSVGSTSLASARRRGRPSSRTSGKLKEEAPSDSNDEVRETNVTIDGQHNANEGSGKSASEFEIPSLPLIERKPLLFDQPDPVVDDPSEAPLGAERPSVGEDKRIAEVDAELETVNPSSREQQGLKVSLSSSLDAPRAQVGGKGEASNSGKDDESSNALRIQSKPSPEATSDISRVSAVEEARSVSDSSSSNFSNANSTLESAGYQSSEPSTAPMGTSPVAPAISSKPRRRSGSVRKASTSAAISTTEPSDVKRLFESQRRSIKDGVACFNCGTLNERTRYYCHHCAYVLPPPPPPPPPLTRWQRFLKWMKEFFARVFYTRPNTANVGERQGKLWRSQRHDSSNETPLIRLKQLGQRFFGVALMAGMVLAYIGPLRAPIDNYYSRIRTDIQKRLQLQYVAVYAVNATASSSLPALPPKNAIDGLANTYWAAQPTSSSGVGQVLTMTFSPSTHIDKIGFIIGADDTAADYTTQPRPSKVTITYNGKSHSTFTLVDSSSFQSFTVHQFGVTTVSIKIDSVYKSPVGKSVSIAEVLFYKLA